MPITFYQKSFWKTMRYWGSDKYCLKLFKEAEFWRNEKFKYIL